MEDHPVIFVAGADVPRAKYVMQALRDYGFWISQDWTDENFDTAYADNPEASTLIAVDLRAAIRRSSLLLLLWKETMESARWEAGMALGWGIPVVVSGDVDLLYGYLADVTVASSDEEAIRVIRERHGAEAMRGE